jgi:pyruvyl transferase EpsI
MDTKWQVKSVVADKSINLRTKYSKTGALLAALDSARPPSSKGLGLKGRIYVFLIRNQLTFALFCLELALGGGGKRLIPWSALNLLRHRFKPLRGMDRIQRSGKTAFVFMVPDLGNLGDLAIGIAQRSFLERQLPDYTIVEIPHGKTYEAAREVAKCIMTEDVVFLTGGGNLGTIYPEAELQRRFLIRKFALIRIVIFPQSVFFEPTRAGSRFLAQSMRIYNRHPKLTLIARDKPSFDQMNKCFPAACVLLWPDIVLLLPPMQASKCRKDRIILSIRRDNESNLDAAQTSAIEKLATAEAMELTFRDTNIDNLHHSLAERHQPVNDIWQAYSNSRLVITDRLHGVIFCAITGTPCIALNNNNSKVRNLIETWLHEASFIALLTQPEPSRIEQAVQRLLRDFPNGAPPFTLDACLHHIRSPFERTAGWQ